jgi:endo-1,4-beta-xylanase
MKPSRTTAVSAQSKWLEIIGPDYIEKAFEYAQQADPEAELYYNDYNMYKPEHCAAAIRLVQSLQQKGLRIDGIGMQGHWGIDVPVDAGTDGQSDRLRKNQRACDDYGDGYYRAAQFAWKHHGADISQNVELQKELNPYPDGLPAEVQAKLAQRYGELFEVLVNPKYNVKRVTFWGVHDGNSWRNNWPVKGRTDYPLLFDRQGRPKPAFKAVVRAGRPSK